MRNSHRRAVGSLWEKVPVLWPTFKTQAALVSLWCLIPLLFVLGAIFGPLLLRFVIRYRKRQLIGLGVGAA